MNSRVVGIKPADAKYRQMLAAWRACKDAGVPAPKEVDAFFGGETPDEKGVAVMIGSDWKDDPSGAVTVYNDNDGCASGFEVDLRKLDPDIKILRFVNSW